MTASLLYRVVACSSRYDESKKSNRVAGGSNDETEEDGKGVKTVNSRACSGSLGDGGDGATVKVISDPKWNVENYMERWEETLDGR